MHSREAAEGDLSSQLSKKQWNHTNPRDIQKIYDFLEQSLKRTFAKFGKDKKCSNIYSTSNLRIFRIKNLMRVKRNLFEIPLSKDYRTKTQVQNTECQNLEIRKMGMPKFQKPNPRISKPQIPTQKVKTKISNTKTPNSKARRKKEVVTSRIGL